MLLVWMMMVLLVSSITTPEMPIRVGSVESMTSRFLDSQGRLIIWVI